MNYIKTDYLKKNKLLKNIIIIFKEKHAFIII
jgi:hypothetical protein